MSQAGSVVDGFIGAVETRSNDRMGSVLLES